MSTKNPYIPAASDEPVYEIDSFELLWEQHKSKIIAAAIGIVVVFVVVFGWLAFSSAQRAAAESAFDVAKTPADYQAVIDKYPSSVVAGDAALLLAKSLRDEKKYDDANKVLNQFAERQPKHPFAPLAKVAAAENLALSGKLEDAAKALEAVSQTDAKSFAAPYALLLEAELKTAQGQRESALQAYRELSKTFSSSISSRASAPAIEAIESMMPAAAAAATPAPAAP
jgi:TolA-binding protein